MWRFFQELEVIDSSGRPTRHFGDPLWVYLKYCRAKKDPRDDSEILAEGRTQIDAVRGHGVFVAEGHGQHPWDLNPALDRDTRSIYVDAKKSIWKELEVPFIATIPRALQLSTQSVDRMEYILHPVTGERLSAASLDQLSDLRGRHRGQYDVQVVVSDGLNALAIMDEGHLAPFLAQLRQELARAGYRLAPEHIVLRCGRVRAGYQIGEALFAGLVGPRAILHVIGERPGTGHHTFSIYITAPDGAVWGQAGVVDHDITKVVSGVAATAIAPLRGADETVRLLSRLAKRKTEVSG